MTEAVKQSVREAWNLARPYIDPATKYGEYSIDMIEEKVVSGQWMVWLGKKCAWVTEMFVNDLGLCMTIPYCGGDMVELLKNYPRIEQMARELGCVKLYMMGRPGWLRVFEKEGFKPEHIIGKRLK